jgi:23S rRNA (adenine2503-C2)-methyltransferase
MGMGEPLDNTEAVLKACQVIGDPWGLAVAPSRITVSTVGIPQGISRILRESKVQLAWSLHSPFDDERGRIMPVNKRHSIDDVVAVIRENLRPGGHVFLQYTMLQGVNDSLQHARALAERVAHLPCKINLIPLNEHRGTSYRRPTLESIAAFRQVLRAAGFVVTVRLSKGGQIQAACGQLVKEKKVSLGLITKSLHDEGEKTFQPSAQ